MSPAPAISDYALIGDTRTAALCSSHGSIDWMCVPRFDSRPVFGRLVGGDEAGCYSIDVEGIIATRRRYRADSAVLETTWWTRSGEVTLTEGMVLEVTGSVLPQSLLVRRIECTRGRERVRIRFDPRRGLPGDPPKARRRSGSLICEWGGSLAVGLLLRPDLELAPGEDAYVELEQGSAVTLALAVADRTPLSLVDPDSAYAALDATDRWWREWAQGARYEGPLRGAVVRSLITLRLLTYAPSGAPVAAPTTSLPEAIGSSRNWDYRFSWPRDASIGLAAFLAVGKVEEAWSFMYWLLHASRLTRPRLEVLYSLHGKPGPRELELWDLPGYMGSRPVRIGNAASRQHQLDVYGWVLDAAWLLCRAGERFPGEAWRALSGFADFVAAHWREPDAGIWEVRGERAHYVHSKLMAWLGLDRALRIARAHPTSRSRVNRWKSESEALAEQVRNRGFDRGSGSYVWAYDSGEVDAALLILPVLQFEGPGSHRLRGTVAAVRERLESQPGLVYRYRPGIDGLEGAEGVFLPCSFWLVQALACLGDVDEAVDMFHALLEASNDVGLLPEELDPSTRAHLGNFPQAFTHATLIQAALAIDEASGERGRHRG